MNADSINQLLQRGFRITVGATSFLVETLQDPTKRDDNLNKLNSDFTQLTEEWAERGEMTEQEARNFVDTILNQQSSSVNSDSTNVSTTNPTTTSGVASDIQRDLLELTREVAALGVDLQTLQESDSQN
ncbi:MAG: hypothetical protein QNJ68_10015 [Microcoleaceae cyanobacterium MO_207.B10]|nr:hypothetical protein [Microcoleaceae cyanobacterium MO_207.B10]